jgi:hypothetical protein
MPMHPSTQVTHMPEAGTMEPSVLFLVNVAAEALILERDIVLLLLSAGQSFVISQATQGAM